MMKWPDIILSNMGICMNRIGVAMLLCLSTHTLKAQLANTAFSLGKMIEISTAETSDVESYITSEGYTYYGIKIDTVKIYNSDDIATITKRYIYGLDVIDSKKEDVASIYVSEETLPIRGKYQKHVKAKEWFVIEDKQYERAPKFKMRCYVIINRNKSAHQKLAKDLYARKVKGITPVRTECNTQTMFSFLKTEKGEFHLSTFENICPDLLSAYYEQEFYHTSTMKRL